MYNNSNNVVSVIIVLIEVVERKIVLGEVIGALCGLSAKEVGELLNNNIVALVGEKY